MPIYEFFCADCNTVFNFFSPTVNTTKIPFCPKCKRIKLKRMMSRFATINMNEEKGDSEDMAALTEEKMERAMQMLQSEMTHIKEDDPKQAASFLRKLAKSAGGKIDEGMEEALRRIESGEDPEQVEAEMGDQLTPESFFCERGKGKRRIKKVNYDETLYDL